MFSVLPLRWFGALESAPTLRGILSGIGTAWAYIFALITYARKQARIATATGAFLDMIAVDFYASTLRRRNQEDDVSFRARLTAGLLAERATRAGVISAVTSLTGSQVEVFEPGRPADTGGYASLQEPADGGGRGYNFSGLAYGSLLLPFQCLIKVRRQAETADLLQVAGYGHPGETSILWASGGYNIGAIEYVTDTFLGDTVTDDDIRNIIIDSMPVNTIAWLSLI